MKKKSIIFLIAIILAVSISINLFLLCLETKGSTDAVHRIIGDPLCMMKN